MNPVKELAEKVLADAEKYNAYSDNTNNPWIMDRKSGKSYEIGRSLDFVITATKSAELLARIVLLQQEALEHSHYVDEVYGHEESDCPACKAIKQANELALGGK